MSDAIQTAVRTAIEAGYLPEVCLHMSDVELIELLLSAVREYDDVIGHFLMLRTQQWLASHPNRVSPSENANNAHDI